MTLKHVKWTGMLLLLLLVTGCRSSGNLASFPDFVLVIDAGHGGNDHGASGRRSHEKQITLKTAQQVKKQIRKKCPRVEVIMTRTQDEYLTLDDRSGMANFFHADLFLSIHANSAKGWAEGTETFIHPAARHSPSERFARLIQDQYVQSGHRKSRGVKTANFAVLRQTRMPAVLTEIGFISNRKEEKFMNSRKGRKKLSRCISRAFIEYYKEQSPLPR